VVLGRSTVSLTNGTGTALSACEGAACCGFAELNEGTLALATGVDFITPGVLGGEDLVRPRFIIILFCFPDLFFVYSEPRSRFRLCSAGNKRKGLLIPVAVGHLVN
jgi:hypothetical protein